MNCLPTTNRRLLLLAALVAGWTLAGRGDEIVIHVSPGGDDAWTGRLAAPNADRTDGPVASLERARDLLRGRRATEEGAALPARVILGDGCHRLTRPFVLAPEDGGTAVAPISYEAAPGARPVVTGGRQLPRPPPRNSPCTTSGTSPADSSSSSPRTAGK